MSEQQPVRTFLRKVGLAFGPFVILGALLVGLFLTSPFGEMEELAAADTVSMLWMLMIVGTIAGIVPVLIGMLWYPFLRTLEDRWIHAVLALSAGVLTFAGVEMLDGILENAAGTPIVGGVVAAIGIAAAFGALLLGSRWQYRRIQSESAVRGLQVAYIIAIGLGLHSIGEGLAIGTAFALGEGRLVTLFVIAFILDNVTEGPTIVAAVASDLERPPLYHFAVMGAIAGGPVILGGWIGSLADAPLLAVLFFAIGLGAILQVILEVIRFVGYSAGRSMWAAATPLNAIGFVAGFLLMVVIDEVVIDMFLL